ncbi:hypothetical protein ASG87_13510 [Frateuria sp. Soil773]|uniref:LysM peptidoglycan-binding domain-containing protein n=1 Tax=Frateuria sp. Soil773 TaxID=1736407 RepID=UPI0006FA4944|nr:LysM peptidoglycan-binding domain-containing protein [Frateuria sp. Soil773]KRE99999.1 hypothetical protein ASG87_13510 [Frateuria sp. Soil773]
MSAVSAATASSSPAQAGGAPEVYYVRSGDSLSGIAQRFGVSLAALEAANPQVSNPNLIFPGERLTIPGGHGGDGPGAPAPGKGGPASGFSISQNGVHMLEGFEGLRLDAYQDSVGVWTIGYGHTHGVRPGQHISQAQAEAYLKDDLGWAQDAVRRNVHVPITQNQFDALVSLTYNLGANGYPGLLADLNRGDYAAAQNDFHDYVHAGGRVLQGLVNRRNQEAALFGSSAPGGVPAPAPAPAPTPAPGNHGGSYTVQPGDTLSGIAQRQGVSLAALRAANPQISNANLIYPGQVIHLPGGSGGTSPASHDYTVRPGDSLSAIADRNGVSLAALRAANPQVKNPNLIFPGQVIHIPGKGAAAPAPAKPSTHSYTVKSGDTLSGIAAKNHVSLAALRAANPQVKNANLIYPGQVIHVPGAGAAPAPAPAPAPKPGTHDYTVRSGDTLSGIAARYGVSLAALERANPQIANFNRIGIGQVIHIPGTGGSGPVDGGGPVKGTDAAAMAKKYLGRYESDLQNAGVTLRCDTSESCANFVTAMLKQSGKLPSGFSFAQRVNVHAMSTGLQNHGWHKVSLASAKPGDVWVCDGAHGESHTEIVASNDGHGHITLIGSNNHPVRSNQQINYDTYSAGIGGSYILAPP